MTIVFRAALLLGLLHLAACPPANDPNNQNEPQALEDAGDADGTMDMTPNHACTALVDRCCGDFVPDEDRPCQLTPSCQQALLYEEQASGPSVIERCRQALEETSLYPRCNK